MPKVKAFLAIMLYMAMKKQSKDKCYWMKCNSIMYMTTNLVLSISKSNCAFGSMVEKIILRQHEKKMYNHL